MNRWVKIGGGVLLLAWAPFLYAELTSSPQEKKEREIREAAEHEEAAEPAAEPAEPESAEAPSEDEPEGEEDPSAKALPDKPTAPVPAKPSDDPGVEPESADELAEVEADPTTGAPDAPPPTKNGPVVALKGAFDAEPRDALWAKDTESRIATIFSGGDIPEGFYAQTSCRKAVCRVDVKWTQENAAPYLDTYEELRQAFAGDIAVDPQAPAGEVPEDGVPVHIYVMRKGYTVADLSK
jgi:hypothetical protein